LSGAVGQLEGVSAALAADLRADVQRAHTPHAYFV
jgi:hypothetical protein